MICHYFWCCGYLQNPDIPLIWIHCFLLLDDRNRLSDKLIKKLPSYPHDNIPAGRVKKHEAEDSPLIWWNETIRLQSLKFGKVWLTKLTRHPIEASQRPRGLNEHHSLKAQAQLTDQYEKWVLRTSLAAKNLSDGCTNANAKEQWMHIARSRMLQMNGRERYFPPCVICWMQWQLPKMGERMNYKK